MKKNYNFSCRSQQRFVNSSFIIKIKYLAKICEDLLAKTFINNSN